VRAQPEGTELVPDASFAQIQSALDTAAGRRNETHRLLALKSEKQGHAASAVRHFTSAARFADKYSQHRLSLAHWHGQGTPVDRAQAYIWADLAAERGHREFLQIRERIWMELSAAERERALAEGPAFYAEYGDAAAKPRQVRHMLAFLRRATGSHTGFQAENLQIAGGPTSGSFSSDTGAGTAGFDGSFQVSARSLYSRERIDREAYWTAQDDVLDWAARGRVEVGELLAPTAN